MQPQGEGNFDAAEWSFKLVNMLLYYLLMTYQLMAVFVSITHDSYRNISIQFGDPLRRQQLTLRQFLKKALVWTFAFLPEQMLRQIAQHDFFTVEEGVQSDRKSSKKQRSTT
jgi:hypothetical protein